MGDQVSETIKLDDASEAGNIRIQLPRCEKGYQTLSSGRMTWEQSITLRLEGEHKRT